VRNKLAIGMVVLMTFLASYRLWMPIAKQNKWVVVASNVWLNALRRAGLRSEQIGQTAELSFPPSQVPTDALRIQQIYKQYLHYARWSATDVAGKRVLEIGPGANIGIPILFASDGADFAAALDKFVYLQKGPYFVSLYTRMREGLSDEQKGI
jgi:hypothetical protein